MAGLNRLEGTTIQTGWERRVVKNLRPNLKPFAHQPNARQRAELVFVSSLTLNTLTNTTTTISSIPTLITT